MFENHWQHAPVSSDMKMYVLTGGIYTEFVDYLPFNPVRRHWNCVMSLSYVLIVGCVLSQTAFVRQQTSHNLSLNDVSYNYLCLIRSDPSRQM